jgi:hypothetical protein
MKNCLTYFLLFLLIAVNAFADSSTDWANNIVVNVINVGGSDYIGNDTVCPAVHIHNEQILTGHTTQENDYAPGIDVPVGGTVTMTIPAPSPCVVYGAAGGLANWSVIVGGTALFSRTVVYYDDSTTPAPSWTPVMIYVNGDTCAATNSPPPVYTNFTVCVQNTLTVAATAQWVFNGSVVKSETLQPGAQDCWTTPSIEVSPTPQNFTLTTSCNPQATTVSTGTNGDLNFNNPTYTNTFSGSGGSTADSGSGGGTFSTGTNGQITFNPPSNGDAIIPNTNSIVWSAGNGTAAQDSTLKQGFDVMHKDLGDLLSGEQILNNTITTITNQLGQVISQLWQGTNNDTMQLVGAITNLAKVFPTNVTASVSFPTNLSLSISNFATEATLIGISNLLANTNYVWNTNVNDGGFAAMLADASNDAASFDMSGTNFQAETGGSTNYADNLSDAASVSEFQAIVQWCSDFLSECSPLDIDENFADPDMTFDFSTFVSH